MTSPDPDLPRIQPTDQLYNQFVALLARHDVAVRRFVRKLLPSSDGVDDVMQETALECWKQFATFQGDKSGEENDFVRWACVVARYKALSWQRDHARDRLVFRESVIEKLAQSAVGSSDDFEAEQSAIQSCLSKMPREQRLLLLSVHTPGASVAQIAKGTGTNARKLYSQLNALRTQLLRCVQNRLAQGVSHGG